MIPASPAMMVPPVKKQRAGNTPEDPIGARTQNAINYRSERLQDLAQKYGTATRAQQPQPATQNGYGAPASIAVPPQSRRVPPTAMNGIGGSVAQSNSRGPTPSASNARVNTAGPPIFETQQNSIPMQQSGPPPKPGMAAMQPRRSDIFPTVAKQSPITSKPSNSFVTAAAIKSPQPPMQSGDAAIARRLDESFQANSTNKMRSKSAPPVRPPPPPGPPPLTKEEPAKNVTFQVPQSSTIVSPPNRVALTGSNSESAVTPDDTTTSNKDAGATPFYPSAPPGATPFRSNVTEGLPTPQTSARRDLLRNMREFAESPDKPLTSPTGSAGSVKSPELRLHEQLASTEKDKAAALRKVAQLEDEISQLKESNSSSNHNRNVGFMSPVANIVPSPVEKRNRRSGTPHPKTGVPKPSTPTEIDEERRCLVEAAKKAPFEYDAEDGITFIVRRPYGLATETDLWYKVGQLPAKLYSQASNVESFSTIEVAATIPCDNSIFLLFGEGEVRHQSNVTGMSTDYGNVEERSTAIGNVMYVDQHAIDKEYSLDELYEFALSVRGHYCTTVRSFAAALQLQPEPPQRSNALPPTTEIVTNEPKSKAIETAEKAVATEDIKGKEEMKESSQQVTKPLPSPPDDESTTDVLASFIQLFFSTIFGTIWFILITLPLRILTTTMVLAFSAFLLSYLWMFFIDENMEMGSSMRIHSNQPGIL